jgi:hypothetical protein
MLLAYSIVGDFTGHSSPVSVIQSLQRWHAGSGLSRALCTQYAMALENLKRYLFLCKVLLAAKSEFLPLTQREFPVRLSFFIQTGE